MYVPGIDHMHILQIITWDERVQITQTSWKINNVLANKSDTAHAWYDHNALWITTAECEWLRKHLEFIHVLL